MVVAYEVHSTELLVHTVDLIVHQAVRRQPRQGLVVVVIEDPTVPLVVVP